MTKAELRKRYLDKRRGLSPEEVNQLNQRICDHFFQYTDLLSTKVLHTFLPIEKNREVDTWLIVERLQKEFPDIRISIPRVNNETSVIESFYYERRDQLETNLWGIPEPKSGIPTRAEEIDVALVPLLTFDKFGNRVGYGRGFYDKFLATCNAGCRKIGLSFFSSPEQIDDVASYDIPLDVVVSASGIIAMR